MPASRLRLLPLLLGLTACGGATESAPPGAADATPTDDVVKLVPVDDAETPAPPDDAETPAPPDDAETPAPPDDVVTSDPQPIVVAADASVDVALDATPDLPRDTSPDAPRDAVVDTSPDVPRDVAVDAPRDVAADAPRDAALDAPRDAAVDVAPDVPVDVPRDVAVDAAAPRPACPAAAGGGSATVRAPVLRRSLRDMGSESWLGAPAVADLDRDGSPEIIAGREQRVVVWNGGTGAVRWGAQPGSARTWPPPVVGDFTGDANLEVVAASGDRVVMYTAAGAVAPGFPVRWRDEVRGLAAGDLDGDGRPEIVAVTTTSRGATREDVVTAFRGNGAVVAGFPPNASGASRCDSACDVAGAFDQNLAVGFLDADNRADVVAPTDNAYMSWHRGSGEAFPVSPLFRGVTRSPGVRFFTSYAEAQAGWAMNESTAEQAHFTTSAPAIADLDGDGTREIVALGSIQNAAQTSTRRGVGLFVVRPDGTRPLAWVAPFQARTYLAGLGDFDGTNVVGMTNQVAVADVDPASAGLEVVFAGFDGRVWCVGADRSTRWSYPYTTANNVVTAGAVIADLSGDGRPEVVFATYSTARNVSALFVLDARGALLHRVALPGRGAMTAPAVADVDRDGSLEIVVSLKDATAAGDEVLVYNVPGSSTNCAPWPMGRRSPLRDGSVPR